MVGREDEEPAHENLPSQLECLLCYVQVCMMSTCHLRVTVLRHCIITDHRFTCLQGPALDSDREDDWSVVSSPQTARAHSGEAWEWPATPGAPEHEEQQQLLREEEQQPQLTAGPVSGRIEVCWLREVTT